MNKRIIISITTSALQTILYYFILYLGGRIGAFFHEPTRMTFFEIVGFMTFLKFSIIAFGITMIIINMLEAFINKKKWTWILLIIVTVAYCFYWVQNIPYLPYKTLLFLVAGLTAVYSKILFDNLLYRLLRRKEVQE